MINHVVYIHPNTLFWRLISAKDKFQRLRQWTRVSSLLPRSINFQQLSMYNNPKADLKSGFLNDLCLD